MPGNTEELLHFLSRARNTAELFATFLSHAVKQLDADAGIAWDCALPPYRHLCVVTADGKPDVTLPIRSEQQLDMIDAAMRSDVPSVHAIESAIVTDLAASPTGAQTLLLAQTFREQREVLQFWFRRPMHAAERQAAAETLQQMTKCLLQFNEARIGNVGIKSANSEESADSAGKLLVENAASVADPKAPTTSTSRQFLATIHNGIELQETADNIANEGRNLLECDRVGVVVFRRGRFRIQSISGQPTVNRRSGTVANLETLIHRVLKTGQRHQYPNEGELPPQIEQALNKYLAVSSSRSIIIEPVFASAGETETDPNQIGERVIGGVFAESFREHWEAGRPPKELELLNQHGGLALKNALQHRQLFLYPLWKVLGQACSFLTRRRMPIAGLVVAAIVAVGLALALIPAPLNIICEGQVLPKTRQALYSEFEATVEQVLVEPGDEVHREQPLLRLANLRLEMELEEKTGQLESLQRTLEILQLVNAERGRQTENTASVKAQISSLEKEIENLNESLSRLIVKSPLPGQVISWQLTERLQDRPVSYGDELIEIAQTDGPWELVVSVPDKKVGHLLRAWQSGQGKVPVKFFIASNPAESFVGEIVAVSRTTRLDPDNKQSVHVVVAFDSAEMGLKHVRSKVQAKINCGETSLGHAWLYPVTEFLNSQVLFRIL